ncbi:monocarboxylate transporter 3-like [Patiria miniata]|uniref:Major facilitator superfamily (MFS) profile domain-containing protein n=1 Tax=Patiria miniata TaxID=46514 RepID=A0A913Z8G4_PATMI|nr:monocarboxylate transporter 3-like [Patiria miniata]
MAEKSPSTDARRRRTHNVEPPDGGWAWVVLAGTFSSQVLSFGFYGAAAVYVPVWMDFFDSSATDTSLVVSLSSFFMGFWSVVAGVLITRFSVRSVWIAGGVLSSSGLLISAFATSTLYLTLSMSLVTALGFSMCVNSGLVVLSIYFKKRLTLAFGIASSGFAAGQVALTPLLDYLIIEYGWKGSMVILGGIMLNMIAAGALMRPLSPKVRRPRLKSKQESESKTNPASDDSMKNSETAQKSREEGFIDRAQARTSGDSTFCSDSPIDDDSVRVCFDDKEILWRKTDDDEEAMQPKAETPADVGDRSPVGDSKPRDLCSLTDSVATNSPEMSNPPSNASQCDSSQSLAGRCRRHLSHFQSFMLHQYGLSGLFRNPSFVLTIPIGIAHGFGWASVVFHLDARAESVGLRASEGATLLTLMGVGAFVTSISHGWFVDKGYISPIIAYTLAILCNLLGSFILPPLVTFGPMVAACVLFGAATGVAEPMIFVILQALVQPSEVAGATSIVLVCWGVGEIIGGTLAGRIYDTLASYNNAYFMAGSVFAIVAILATIMFFLEKRKTKGDKKLVSKTNEAGTGEAQQRPSTAEDIHGKRLDENIENGVVNPMYSGASNNEVQQEIHTVEQQDEEMAEISPGNKDESSC